MDDLPQNQYGHPSTRPQREPTLRSRQLEQDPTRPRMGRGRSNSLRLWLHRPRNRLLLHEEMVPGLRARGFASNYTRIVEIIKASASPALAPRANLDWDDQIAKEYVLAAFEIGFSVEDIVAQLHIHGYKMYQITEKLVINFLKEMDVM